MTDESGPASATPDRPAADGPATGPAEPEGTATTTPAGTAATAEPATVTPDEPAAAEPTAAEPVAAEPVAAEPAAAEPAATEPAAAEPAAGAAPEEPVAAGPVRRRRGLFGAVAAVLAVAGIALVVIAVLVPSSTPPPPQPTALSAGVPATTESGPPVPSAAATPAAPVATGPVLARSMPVELDVPSIGVHSTLLQLGANPDQTIQVPPLEKDSKAGWFTYSPTPGQLGPSVLLGHVDSAQWGPGVFYRLGALKPGQQAEVTRADGTVAIFVVDRVESYPKDAFPSLQVYGNTSDAELRLITCGGVFDRAAHNYENNIVAFAHLVGTRSA